MKATLIGVAVVALLATGPATGAPKPRCLGAPATIVGTPGDDVLVGTKHRDVIVALSGDDVIRAGGGSDRICGGEGVDTLSFAAAQGPVDVDLADGSAAGEGDDGFEGIENLVGSPFADSLAGDAGENTIEGLAGDDALDGHGGRDTVSFASFPGRPGTSGPIGVGVSLLSGSAFGAGTDTLSGFEDVLGSAYSDVLAGDGADNVLRGLGGSDSLQGLGGADVLEGGDAPDGLFGGPGRDRLSGGPGNDTAAYSDAPSAVTVDLAAGAVSGGDQDVLESVEIAFGSAFDDSLYGDDAQNSLDGGAGADLVMGFGGDDFLYGAGGDDILRGGPGTDRLEGGDAVDECVEGETLVACERAAADTLRVESAFDLDHVDPALAFFSHSWQFLDTACLRLFRYADGLPPRLEPDAAASPGLVSPGGLTWTFTVRAGLRFSSGEPVTAAAFARALERARVPALQSPAASYIGDIVSWTADGRTLIVNLARPAGDLPARLSMVFFCAVPPDTPAVSHDDLPPLASAGPYRVASWTRGSAAVLERNGEYRGRRSSVFDRIEYVFGHDLSTAMSEVEAGRSDHTLGFPFAHAQRLRDLYGPGSAAAAAGRQRYFVQSERTIWFLALNTERVFADERLRRAVAYAVDRTTLASLFGTDGATPTDQLLQPPLEGFEDVSVYPLTADLAAARALAEQAGVTPTERLAVTLYTFATGNGPAIAQHVHDALEPLGIDVAVATFDRVVQAAKIATRGEGFDIGVHGWAADYLDPYNTLDLLLNGSRIQPTSNVNVAYFDDPAFNARLDAAASLDGGARAAAYAALDRDLTAAAPLVPFANPAGRWLFGDRIGCHTFNPLTRTALNALCVR